MSKVSELSDYLEDDWPSSVQNLRDRCEAAVRKFSNDDMSVVINEYERLRILAAAAVREVE